MEQILLNIIYTAGLNSLLALSFSLLFSVYRFFNMGHAVIISSGGYFTFVFLNELQLPFLFAAALAIGSSVLLAVSADLFIFKRMRNIKAPVLSFFIASMGIYILFTNSIALVFGDDTKTINTAEVQTGHNIFGGHITTVQLVTIFSCFALYLIVNFFLRLTLTGKSIRAVSSNPELCIVFGINTNRVILKAIIVSSALASAAGMLSAMDTNMKPFFGFNLLLSGIVVVIITGIGNTTGLIKGAFFCAAIQHFSVFFINAKWMDTFVSVILILFLLWKPLGFSGKPLRSIEI